MNYEKFKSNVINLGFEETDVFDDNETILIEAANRALIFLNMYVEKKEKYVKYEIPSEDISDSYRKIKLEEFDDFDGVSLKAPKINGKAITDFYYEDNTLFISTQYSGNLSLSYYVKTELIPDNPSEEYEIKIKDALIPILQLLTAYYVWLDDDERKAITYYNQYTEQLQLYLLNKENENSINTAVIEGGIDI